MRKNTKENFTKNSISKRALALAMVVVTMATMFAGCKNGTSNVNESQFGQSGSDIVNVETEKVDSEEHNHESDADVDSNTDSDSETNNGTETGEQTNHQTGKEDDAKQDVVIDNAPEREENDDLGLDEDSYEYILNELEHQEEREVELAREIVKKIIKSGMSDFEKAKAINDYIILNVTYDIENYKTNTIPAESYTALGAMENKIAVCAGYAKMFKLLANEAGLESTYKTGDTPYGYHAWNQVKIDGEWYNIDVTWNDPDCEIDEDGHYYCGCYEYFLLSNESFEKTHTPFGKVNESGTSDKLSQEAYKLGCPYDNDALYCVTQEDFDALIKEMVDGNITTKRILTDNVEKKEMVVNALKKVGIYSQYEVIIRSGLTVYLEPDYTWKKVTINIVPYKGTFDDIQGQKVTSVDEAKKVLAVYYDCFAVSGYDEMKDRYLYVSSELVNNLNFEAELTRWSCYERKMNLIIYDMYKQIDDDLYEVRVHGYPTSSGESVVEIITSTKDMEAAILRMFQYEYKKITMKVYPSDYIFVEDDGASRREFEKQFCKVLCEKYCLRSSANSPDVENNSISVTFVSEGHDVSGCSWVVEKEATCVSEGLEVKICWICKKAGQERAIPKNENHSLYWEQNGDNRTQKCNACPYVGITEVCIGGVWGYFDVAAAEEELIKINCHRMNIQKLQYDDWGNATGIIRPEPLTIDDDLIAFAKERLAILNAADFKGAISAEYAIRMLPYSKTYNAHRIKEVGLRETLYHESYNKIGIVCFMFDCNDDATEFGEIFVMELGLAEE